MCRSPPAEGNYSLKGMIRLLRDSASELGAYLGFFENSLNSTGEEAI